MKREPIPHKVNIGAVTDMGAFQTRPEGGVPLYGGRGYEAPAPVTDTRWAGGSQGKH